MKSLICRALLLSTAVYMSNIAFAQTNEVLQSNAQLSLEKAMLLAVDNDPWQQKSVYEERSTLAQGAALSAMPDPMMSIALVNLPSDGFAFDQEPMTQLKAGVSQAFLRGDTGKLRQQQQTQLSQQQPLLRKDRKTKVAINTAHVYLDAYFAMASIRLIENDRDLFEQLTQIVQRNYASGVGNTRQQDLLRADLELMRIEDRLLALGAQQDQAIAKLSEWIAPSTEQDKQSHYGIIDFSGQRASEWLPSEMPRLHANTILDLIEPEPKNSEKYLRIEELTAFVQYDQANELANLLSYHPYIQSIEQHIAAGQSGIELAKQAYKPQWQVNASYAYRADEPNGRSRADFLSLGLSFDLPLFTETRQDQNLQAAVSSAEALKTEKRLALRHMMSELRAVFANYQRLLQRQQLYQARILTQSQQQAEATLNAYTNDEGDFEGVVRSRIALLNAKLDALKIDIDLLKTKAQLAYFFVQGKGAYVSQTIMQQRMPLKHITLTMEQQ